MITKLSSVVLSLVAYIFITSHVSATHAAHSDPTPSSIYSEEAVDDLSLPTLLEGLCAIANSPKECAEKREYIRVLKPAAEDSFNDFVLFVLAIKHAQHGSPEKIQRLLNRAKQIYKELLLELGDLDIEDTEALRAEYLLATEPSFIDAAEKIGFYNFRNWYLKDGYQELLSNAEKIRTTIVQEAQRFPTPTNRNRFIAFERLYRVTIQYSLIKDVLKLNPHSVETARQQTAYEFSWFYMFSITRKA